MPGQLRRTAAGMLASEGVIVVQTVAMLAAAARVPVVGEGGEGVKTRNHRLRCRCRRCRRCRHAICGSHLSLHSRGGRTPRSRGILPATRQRPPPKPPARISLLLRPPAPLLRPLFPYDRSVYPWLQGEWPPRMWRFLFQQKRLALLHNRRIDPPPPCICSPLCQGGPFRFLFHGCRSCRPCGCTQVPCSGGRRHLHHRAATLTVETALGNVDTAAIYLASALPTASRSLKRTN